MNLLSLDELPPLRRLKADQLIKRVESEPLSALPDVPGKRLKANRRVISVDLAGNEYRLLFVDQEPDVVFCAATTHASFNQLLNRTDDVRLPDQLLRFRQRHATAVEHVAATTPPPTLHFHTEEPPTVPDAPTSTPAPRGALAKRYRTYLASQPLGYEFENSELVAKLGMTPAQAASCTSEACSYGWVVRLNPLSLPGRFCVTSAPSTTLARKKTASTAPRSSAHRSAKVIIGEVLALLTELETHDNLNQVPTEALLAELGRRSR